MKLIFLGPPGVGKGTYASRIGPELGIPQISTGDLVRKEIREATSIGLAMKERMNSGHLVPDDKITELLKKRLQEDDTKNGFILDGFPRTIKQAELLESISRIDMVVNLSLREDILMKKIAARRTCRKCGQTYNIADIQEEGISMPPLLPKKEGICDKCDGSLYQRDDDKEEVVKERLAVYRKETTPLIDFYKNKGLLLEVKVTSGPKLMVPKIIEMIRSK